jgi:multiple sugar transport system permease protein
MSAPTPAHARAFAMRLLLAAALMLAALVFAYPLLFMFAASFKPADAIFADIANPLALLPDGRWSLVNYHHVFDKSAVGSYLLNSSVIALVTIVAGVFVNSALAFAIAKLQWRGRHGVLALVLALLIVPLEVLAIPMMLVVAHLPWFDPARGAFVVGWLDTLHVQIVPFVANAFCVFLFHQAFKDLPDELIEAARMDGAGALTIYLRIVLPLCKPTVATAAIVIFLAMWNQYLWPVMTVQTGGARPVMVGLQLFFGRTNQWGEIMAYASLITLPVLAFFLVIQKHFVRSVVGSGIKG